ncbi:acetoacetate decarboxylase family protein [Stieleria varia]|uniref:Acetoacetate decarboxylase n=1 Tax=Stieleria varia TaxID=2528005 RepID=A0A5C6B6J6_9BACT|nr:acetoacetate decarboxylase family protein [Stieleria varia]TWU07568.1 acetoacetate decarboxylase [Stieleria varia]
MNKTFDRRKLLATGSALGLVGLAPRSSAEDGSSSSKPMVSLRGRIEAEPNWLMPIHFGPIEWGGDQQVGAPQYEVTAISLKYVTDEEQLTKYLPVGFELDGPPLLNITYSQNTEISWLAGGQYNIVAVTAHVRFNGEQDVLTGEYALVLWENLAEPILAGREALGIPKIHGDIEDHRISNGIWSTRLSKNGSAILDLEASNAEKVETAQLKTLRDSAMNHRLLGWKYIPNENCTAPLVSYATVLPSKSVVHEAWSAQGNLDWHTQAWKTNPTQSHIVNALASLPIVEKKSCTITRSSKTLLSGKARRLV